MATLTVAMRERFLSTSWYRAAGLRPVLAEGATIRLHRYRGRLWYVVSDPSTGRAHRLTANAASLVAQMDGRRTVDEIWSEAARQLGKDAPTQDQTLHLFGQLHAADLLRAGAVPDTGEMLDRLQQHEAQRRRGLLNPLSLRLRLWNPDRFVRWILPILGRVFSLPGLLAWLLAVGAGAALAAHNWSELTTGASDRILATGNLLLLAASLPLVKALHELSHAVAARRFGACVPETGLMFLMLLPMPYVDTSAVAALRSPAQRMIVGAAGMMAELALAAMAMVLWVLVEPGLLRALAFNVVVAASTTTVLFNANPLMRYDGYYILIDAIGIPNLGLRATRFWGHLVERYAFGREMPAFVATTGERGWFILYAPAAVIYRLTVTFGIALFLADHYWALGVALALWCVGTMAVAPVLKAMWHVVFDPSLRQVRVRAVGLTLMVLLLAVAGLFCVPAPQHTVAEGVIWLPETASVRAGTDGFVQRLLAQPGQVVGPGVAVAESMEPTLEARRAGLLHRVEELSAQLQSERFSKLVDALVTETELHQAMAELADAEARTARLVARSRGAGVFAVPRPADLTGHFLREGDLLAYVLPLAGDRLVRASIPQDDLDLVRHHLRRVELMVAGNPDRSYAAQLVREVPGGRDVLPSKALGTAGGGSIDVDPRDDKGLRTLHRTFEVDIALPPEASLDVFGSRVHVRLEHEWEPLGEQVLRRLRQVLLSRLQT